MSLAVEPLIRKKRDGGALTPAEIASLIEGITEKTVPDYQTSALLMAIYFRGLSDDELAPWLAAMTQSGRTLDFSHLPAAKVDKHSTGGVGDKISICLAPAVAACGLYVPMISGRGLGHTGGTLDKLEAMPGFRTDLSTARFGELVAKHGFAFAGQTEDLAPADRILYALRDVTATVESIPLIASSILSKKLAEGIDGLVLDVKTGHGAFMKSDAQARRLGETLVALGRSAGKRVVARLTAMDDPIGVAVGNLAETWEAVDVMRGGGPVDTVALTVELGAEMLLIGDGVGTIEEGRTRIREALSSGAAFERFARVVADQGGDPRVFDRDGDRHRAPSDGYEETLVRSPRSGWIGAIDAFGVGRAAMSIGAGRRTKEDQIDPLASVFFMEKRGQRVEKDQPIARVCARGDVTAAVRTLAECFYIVDEAPAEPALFLERIA